MKLPPAVSSSRAALASSSLLPASPGRRQTAGRGGPPPRRTPGQQQPQLHNLRLSVENSTSRSSDSPTIAPPRRRERSLPWAAALLFLLLLLLLVQLPRDARALPFRGGSSRRTTGDEDEGDPSAEGERHGVQEAVVPPHATSTTSHHHQQDQPQQQDQDPPMIHIVRRGASSSLAAASASGRGRGASGLRESGPRRPRRNALVDGWMMTERLDASEDEWTGHSSTQVLHEIRNLAHNLTDQLVEWRRTLHRYPELMYQEKQTSAYVQSVLNELGVPYSTGWGRNKANDVDDASGEKRHHEGTNTLPRPDGPGGYGIVAELGTGNEPCVLLRADMDALPIFERTTNIDDFKSRRDGIMHACGHDGHTTMLLGAVAILKSMEESIPGTIRFMFQPAEEGGAGAKRMREEGVLTQIPKPSHAFAIHVWPTLPSGVVASRPGPLLAACERFEILVAGVGGHAAMPHLTVDPIVAASAVVMNLQHIVSRTVSPLESGVVSITKFEAGAAFNVIPASATLRGTIRALSTDTLLKLRERVENVVKSTSNAHGCNVTILYSPDYYPPTVNDPDLYHSFSQHVARLVSSKDGPGGPILDVEPTMGAEDFSFVAEAIPSTFFLLGQGGRQEVAGGGRGATNSSTSTTSTSSPPPTSYGLHHPHFNLDESVLSQGVELHVNLALRALRKLHDGKNNRGESSLVA